MKSMFTRPLVLVLCTALLAAAGQATELQPDTAGTRVSASPEPDETKVRQEAAATRRRAARPSDPNSVVLVGTVTDAATGEPVFEAVVTVGSRSATAMGDGTFRLERLPVGSASATIERWGYNPQTRNVALVPGSNTLNITLTSKPFVTLTTRSGQVNRLDFESSYFSDIYPFQGLRAIAPLDLCTFNGSNSSAEKDTLRLVTFTGQKVANPNCCASPMTGYAANVTLKSGTPIDVILVNSCTAYSMGFYGRHRSTGAFTNYPLSEIARIEFP